MWPSGTPVFQWKVEPFLFSYFLHPSLHKLSCIAWKILNFPNLICDPSLVYWICYFSTKIPPCSSHQLLTDASRKNRWAHNRFDWEMHADQLIHENQFHVEYRMKKETWDKLYDVLNQKLQRKHSYSRSRRPVTVVMIMAAGIRFLAGGPIRDIRHVIGLSRAEAYKCVRDFIAAVNSSTELDIKLPRTAREMDSIRAGFAIRSSNSLMQGCLGAVDGFFVAMSAPDKSDCINVRAYYSGHYESYGLHCQALCDSKLRFLYFGVVAPGKTNDNAAYPLCTDLVNFVDNLPSGLYIVGDAAYTCTDRLLTPFVGPQKQNVCNDAFNFHLSQMRIRIEMSFGRLVRKFGILKHKLNGKLSTRSAIIMDVLDFIISLLIVRSLTQ
jgi:hypothetical protein